MQDGVCQVFLYDGQVVVQAGNSEIKTQKTYNDDSSHYIAIYNNVNGYVMKFKLFSTVNEMWTKIISSHIETFAQHQAAYLYG